MGEPVERGERRWLHRVATTVCRDSEGRVLVHRRQEGVSRFPGQCNWLIGGAAEVGESYEEAAARELTEGELREAFGQWTFVEDGVDAFRRYVARPVPGRSGRQCSSK
ncbi:NUDIX domain-containing protein [Streptomyces sp. NPDC057099]|uniref:NUDIX domain-containing protein n=1 Tax=Streptomyces sp. NPDC057099 TaxID=3346019 RepID=UPI0036352B5C